MQNFMGVIGGFHRGCGEGFARFLNFVTLLNVLMQMNVMTGNVFKFGSFKSFFPVMEVKGVGD